MTIPQALDYAMKDFLSAGLNCVEYSNGNRVNIASYAEMDLRTSSSEVTRQANGDVRNVLNEYLVVSNVIGMTCPYCQKWQGKVMIDDVYSDGKPDGEHRLVSEAKLYNGEIVIVYEKRDRWGRISTDMDLWVSMDYLKAI